MNPTNLMLRDAAYMAQLIVELPKANKDKREKNERIILRILHRNNCTFTNTILAVFTDLSDAGFTLSEPRAVDLIQARLYNLIRQSCGIADENNKIIIKKETDKNEYH